MTTIIFLLMFILKTINSVQIGYIKHASIITNTSFISTSSLKCLDCLCNCLNNSTIPKCHGINCFPSNHSCQQIKQSWIQEKDILFNSTSDQFINSIDLNFCSCYTSQHILDIYQNITPISISHTLARYITYNIYDDTLIVLGDRLIGQYFASNLTRFQSLSTTLVPLAAYIDSMNIYISFDSNISVNQYDMHMRFLQSIKSPITIYNSNFYGLTKWNNQLLVSDDQLQLIWSINLNKMNMSIYINLTSYDITPLNIAVFNNNLYISQLSLSIIYIVNLISFSIQYITFPNSIPLYRLQIDPFCNRLWFGTSQTKYTSVPVLNLDTNQPYIYQAKGSLAQSATYKVEFDSDYSMYTVAKDGNSFFKYTMSSITC